MKFQPFRVSRIAAVLTLASLAPSAFAQRHDSKAKSDTRAKSEQLIQGRDRELMHPGNPLTVVGVEQGGHDIRSMTPALEQSDRHAARVDPDELHRRTLALYERGALFTDPTSPDARTVDALRAPSIPEAAPAPGGDVGLLHSVQWFVWAILALVLAVLAFRFTRRSTQWIAVTLPEEDALGPMRVPARNAGRTGVTSAGLEGPRGIRPAPRTAEPANSDAAV